MIKAQSIGFTNTSPLWKEKQFDIQQFEFPEINIQKFEPKVLRQNLRLGHQMEIVFKQLIEYADAYEIALHNYQIKQRERTIGEIDFILKDKKSNKLIHVELTYKFYLINPENKDPKQLLIGPNKRDMFYLKMNKIKNQQFTLLHSEEGTKALAEVNIDHIKIEHQCCFKAQLFKPFGSGDIDISPLNNDCLVGYWMRFEDFNSSNYTNAQFYIPSKSEWVIEPHIDVAWTSHLEILIEIDQRLLDKNAPMLWLKKSKTEFEKLFVVWW